MWLASLLLAHSEQQSPRAQPFTMNGKLAKKEMKGACWALSVWGVKSVIDGKVLEKGGLILLYMFTVKMS